MVQRKKKKKSKEITVVLGPTSVGKSTFLNKWKKLDDSVFVIDIDKEWNKQDDHFRAKWFMKNSKWNWSKYKRDFISYLEDEYIPVMIRNALRNSKRVYLPHIMVPESWRRMFRVRVEVLFRPINETLRFSSMRPSNDRRSFTQVLKDYMRLFEFSPKPSPLKIRPIHSTFVKDIPKKLVDRYNKHFNLVKRGKMQSKSNIKPKNIDGVSTMVVVDMARRRSIPSLTFQL